MKGMEDLLRQAQLMQSKMAQVQAELAKKTVEGTSGGGMVRVTVTGAQLLTSVSIDKTVIDPEDPEMLQDMVMAAVNDALRASRELADKELTGITGGLGIPGLG